MPPLENASRLPDPLWVPILTHYLDDGTIDSTRMDAHIDSLRPHVRQIMFGGSTGDGWELDETRFQQLLATASGILRDGDSSIFGALRATTAEVISRIENIERALAANESLAARNKGVVVCPPVGAAVTQQQILDHFDEVQRSSKLNLAIYQLPQVTGCRIEPETMVELARSPRVTMFKDSSGEDTVAAAGLDYGRVVLVRGAEGGYLEALQPRGPYHGWLLSTGNALAKPLRAIEDAEHDGDLAKAARLSSKLTTVVDTVFGAAQSEGGANAFSNANRAMDHLRAHGQAWRNAPPALKVDGSSVSADLIEAVESFAASALGITDVGYLAR